MGIGKFLKAAAKAVEASSSASKNKSAKSGLGFQQAGTSPKTDKAGRVIVILKSGSEVIVPVHTYKITDLAAQKIAGKPKLDEEFDKSAKTRVCVTSIEKGKEEVRVETVDGDFIGVVKRESAEFAATLFKQTEASLISAVPELQGKSLVFEVSANITGYWAEDEDEDGKSIIETTIEEINLKIKAPVTVEIN